MKLKYCQFDRNIQFGSTDPVTYLFANAKTAMDYTPATRLLEVVTPGETFYIPAERVVRMVAADAPEAKPVKKVA